MYRLLEPQPEKRLPLEKMTEDPWFQSASSVSVDPALDHEHPMFPIPHAGSKENVKVQDTETGRVENAKYENQAVEREPTTVWSKNKELNSSSTTVRTQGNKSAKSAPKSSKSGK